MTNYIVNSINEGYGDWLYLYGLEIYSSDFMTIAYNTGSSTLLSLTTGGVAVTGLVKSYNPSCAATIVLKQDGVVKYSTTIEEENRSGQVTQPFAFTGVMPGTYTLVVTKPGHTSFTVSTITVGDADIDLTQDMRPEVRAITMLCGDINGDNMINDADLTVLWRTDNYKKSTAIANNPLSDLNGDGMVNDADLTILWRTDHYNKGSVTIP